MEMCSLTDLKNSIAPIYYHTDSFHVPATICFMEFYFDFGLLLFNSKP